MSKTTNDDLTTSEKSSSTKSMQQTVQMGKKTSTDHYVDELQALNTALCFLCSINADSIEVERFLTLHPEALLLEGACMLPEDSAHYILEQHMHRCTCNGQCSSNRKKVIRLLNLSFEYFHSKRQERTKEEEIRWLNYFQRLVELEHKVRILRRDELLLRNTLVETTIEVKTYKDEFNNILNKTKTSSSNTMFACTKSKIFDNSQQSQLSVLEYQVGVASVNLRSVEREHARLLQHIRDGRRAQFSILKNAFEHCIRHDICSLGYVAPPTTTTKKSDINNESKEEETNEN